jgi:hypothetical protein
MLTPPYVNTRSLSFGVYHLISATSQGHICLRVGNPEQKHFSSKIGASNVVANPLGRQKMTQFRGFTSHQWTAVVICRCLRVWATARPSLNHTENTFPIYLLRFWLQCAVMRRYALMAGVIINVNTLAVPSNVSSSWLPRLPVLTLLNCDRGLMYSFG